jgi:membrane-bound lytic murein transglycosylase B
MYGGALRSRAGSWARGLRRAPARAGLTATVVAVLAAAFVAGRQPSREVLATAPVPPSAPSVTAPTTAPVHLPDPDGRAVHNPASPSQPGSDRTSTHASGIPQVALTAYQRSAAVINAADPSCRLDWSLLGAIGQVESDHGQVGGSRLNGHGVAHPAIIGPRLDGRHGTSLVRDTDAGRLDGDRRFDRAVGPMQFLPSTWAAVAVDGDGDGRRDVQDINDAALGSAVYLCADHDDLATKAGKRAALLRYNHSHAYVTSVLAIAHALHTSSQVLPSTDISVRSVSFDGPLKLHEQRGHHRHLKSGHPTNEPTAGPTLLPSPHGPVISDPIPPISPTTGPTPTPSPTPTPTPTPTDPPDPTDPTEPPVIPDPLPIELADLTPDQVDAYNAAWAVCDDDLAAGWSTSNDQREALTQCLADEVGVPLDDPDLVTFVDWLAVNEDGPPDCRPAPPSGG